RVSSCYCRNITAAPRYATAMNANMARENTVAATTSFTTSHTSAPVLGRGPRERYTPGRFLTRRGFLTGRARTQRCAGNCVVSVVMASLLIVLRCRGATVRCAFVYWFACPPAGDLRTAGGLYHHVGHPRTRPRDHRYLSLGSS